MTEPSTPAESSTAASARLPKPLLAAWILLSMLFAWAFVAHEWAFYGPGLAAFALVATILCLLDERAAIVLFVGCSALDAYGYITHVPFSLNIPRVVVVALVAGAALRWLRAKPRSRFTWRHITVWDLGILVFLAAAALSVPFSYSLALSGVGILHLIFLVGAYFVLSRAARTAEGRGDIMTATIAAGSVTALVALGQAFVNGFPVEVLRATQAIGGAAEVVRASGFFDNPNTMALLLVLAALFAAERAFAAETLGRTGLCAAAVALALAGIGVSFSRAALVGVAVGAVVLGALLIRGARERIAFLAGLVLLFALVLAIPGVGERAYSIVDFTADASAMDRVYLSEVSVLMFADHPVSGVGIQAFRAAYPDYEDSRVTIDPVTDGHQMPFSIPAEVGVLGLIAEVLLAGGLLFLLVQSFRAGHEPLTPAGLAAMAAISAMALFNTFVFFDSLWIAAALVGADFAAAHRKATGGA